MVSLQFAGACLAAVACGIGCWTDVRKGVIPNWITMPALALGLALAFVVGGGMGLLLSLLSALATAMVPLVLFRMNAMGGGDVKLFGALGALLGIDLALQVLMASFLFGSLFGIGLWLVRGEFKVRFLEMLKRCVPMKLLGIQRKKSALSHTFIRFGPAILAACVLTIALNPEMAGIHGW